MDMKTKRSCADETLIKELVEMVKTYKGWVSDSRRLMKINDLLERAENKNEQNQ